MKDKKPLEHTTKHEASANTITTQGKTQNKPSDVKRRHLVGALGGVAAAVWHKPIIDAVVLPTHAQMSGDMGLPQSFFNPAAEPTSPIASNTNSVLGKLIPDAHAGGFTGEATLAIGATKIDETRYSVDMLNFTGNLLRSGTLLVDGTQGSLTFVSNACTGPDPQDGNPIDAKITKVDDSGMALEINLDGSLYNVEMMAGGGSVSPSCAVTASQFTTDRRRLSSQNNVLLDKLLPLAHAGDDPSDGLLDFQCNATYSGGSFDVDIVGELAVAQAVLAGSNVQWEGFSIPFDTPTVISAADGCDVSATVTISSPGRPNQFEIEVAALGNSLTRTLREGQTILPVLSDCSIPAT